MRSFEERGDLQKFNDYYDISKWVTSHALTGLRCIVRAILCVAT